MLSIRLARVGRRNAPSYRVVVMPKQRDPWAKATEIVGHYNPRQNPKVVELNAERIQHWIANGAQPTDTVWNLLVQEGIVKGEKRGITHLSKKRRGKLEEKETARKEAEEAKKAAAEEAKKAAEEEKKAQEEAAKAEAEAAEAPAAEEKAEEAPAEEAGADKAEEKTEEKEA